MQFRIKQILKSLMLALVVGLALPLSIAVADPLDDARVAGQIGERPDGYVAAVQPSPSPQIQQLVTDINAQRRQVYEQLAGQKGVPVEEVGALAAEKTIAQKLKPGMYYMNNAGQWVQK
ncbi:MAG TPA: YdbL family protein [Candidatus Cybelea sp.]|nr:YdbL family protein [Candidatus Cybelea sp.]